MTVLCAGPVTILNWSFPRKDITRQAQAFQLALAIREEVADLEKAGCKVIQVSSTQSDVKNTHGMSYRSGGSEAAAKHLLHFMQCVFVTSYLVHVVSHLRCCVTQKS